MFRKCRVLLRSILTANSESSLKKASNLLGFSVSD